MLLAVKRSSSGYRRMTWVSGQIVCKGGNQARRRGECLAGVACHFFRVKNDDFPCPVADVHMHTVYTALPFAADVNPSPSSFGLYRLLRKG